MPSSVPPAFEPRGGERRAGVGVAVHRRVARRALDREVGARDVLPEVRALRADRAGGRALGALRRGARERVGSGVLGRDRRLALGAQRVEVGRCLEGSDGRVAERLEACLLGRCDDRVDEHAAARGGPKPAVEVGSEPLERLDRRLVGQLEFDHGHAVVRERGARRRCDRDRCRDRPHPWLHSPSLRVQDPSKRTMLRSPEGERKKLDGRSSPLNDAGRRPGSSRPAPDDVELAYG